MHLEEDIHHTGPEIEPLPDPEEDGVAKRAMAISRRVFLRATSLLGVGVLADLVSGGQLQQAVLKEDAEIEEAHELKEEIDKMAEEVVEKVTQGEDIEEMSQREKALLTVNVMGTVLFASGIRNLLPGGKGHIDAYHYAALAALTTIKYQLEDDEGKHHLVAETKSSASALAIISGTIVGAEGLTADVEEMYELNTGKHASRTDKVALMTMLASAVSPVTTTVGSASIIKGMSNDLANGDEDIMAVCVSHISNLSGFILFGDPPFIAVAEKYGFVEGVSWQLRTMLPLALYSLFSATHKLNYILNRKDGLSKTEAHAKAAKESMAGLTKNIPVLAKIIAKSLVNVATYYTAGNFTDSFKQNPAGIEVKIAEVLTHYSKNFGKLPFAADFDITHDPEAHKGLIHDEGKEVKGANTIFGGMLEILENNKDPEASVNKHFELRKAINEENYDRVEELGQEMGIEKIDEMVYKLRDYHDNHRLDNSPDMEKAEAYSLKELLNPLEIYHRATDVNRVQNALGHNLADVVNVFPFQAGCVPFLIPMFKRAIDSLDGLNEEMQKSIAFFMIMIFSMMADNYVGCKIGLELYPEQPSNALIASIQGGSMTAIGNMANIAQFSMDKYPLMASVRKMGWHLDNVAVAFLWNKALEGMQNVALLAPPKLPTNVEGVKDHTRRDFFKLLAGKQAA